MVHEAPKRLTRYVYENCGESLRTVVVETEDEWESIYLRDDLQEKYISGTYGTAVEAFRSTQLDTPDVDSLPLGERYAAVFYHENAFVLQFRYSDTETILVSVETQEGKDLSGFINNCRRVVRGEL